ncbi:MAG: hypothetical protein IKD75_02230 [Prevotella sp.]|jgi:hypothetical protein|nr:hypothetical protein [Prevotella sp.]
MKKILFLIVFLAAVAIALVATCPDREAHLEAIQSVVSAVINSEIIEQKMDDDVASIGSMLAGSAIKTYLNSSLIIRDRTFYNVGVINYDGEMRMVSVGIFNHVFTIDEDTARQLMKDKTSSLFKLPLF